MNKIEIVKKAFSFETPLEERNGYLSDDFQFVDSIGSPPTDKEGWLAMGRLIQASVPDMGYIITEIHQEGEDVIFTGHFTGTFKHDLDLSALNMGVIPATGKALNFPDSSSRISFTGEKISKNQNLDTGPNAGLAGFMTVFGAD